MKTEVYSWRVSTDVKSSLEREARRQKTSVSAVLDLAAREWLKNIDLESNDDREQLQLHETALQCIGTLASGNARRSENAREAVRQRLRRTRDR